MRPFSGQKDITFKGNLLPHSTAKAEPVDRRLFKILLEKI
jgi:hypothetical protein